MYDYLTSGDWIGVLREEAVEDGGAHSLDSVDRLHPAVAQLHEVPGRVCLPQLGVEELPVEEGPRQAHLEGQRGAARVVGENRHLDPLRKISIVCLLLITCMTVMCFGWQSLTVPDSKSYHQTM